MENIYDIAIIGSGTAGMTAAIYGQRAGKKVLLIERAFYGGQIISSSEVENYPGFAPASGYDFASELHEQITRLALDQVSDEATGLERIRRSVPAPKDHETDCWKIQCRKNIFLSKTVIIASGTKNRPLSLPGEEQYLGRGLSYCAICDGAFFKDRTVSVVGGGNTALEDALYLSLLCEKVYLIHRGDHFSAEASLQTRIAEHQNIQTLMNTNVIGLYGTDRLEKIEILPAASGGSKSPDHAEQQSEPSAEVLESAALFVAIGQLPQNEAFARTVKLDQKGYIVAGEDCHTDAEGIYAAGDCRTKELRQLVTAAADGAVAATEAIHFINRGKN